MTRKGHNSAIVFTLSLMMFSGNATSAQTQNSTQIEIAQSARQLQQELQQLSQQISQLYQQGRYEEAIPLQARSLSMYRRLHQGIHSDLATAIGNLALLYDRAGQSLQAESYYQQALEMRQQLFTGDHSSIALSLNNLAAFYDRQGNYEEAQPLFQRALEMYQRLHPEDHLNVAASLDNLGLTYIRQGKYKEAEPLLKQALAMYQRLHQGNHSDVAMSLDNLGLVYFSQGKYQEAEPLLKQALAMKKELFGENHPQIANTLNNLGEVYRVQGKYEAAEPLLKQALAMKEQRLGDIHPDVVTSLNNLGKLYRSQGKYEAAEPLLEKALAINKQLYDGFHPDIATSLNNLGELYRDRGRYRAAEQRLKEALAMKRVLFRENHPEVATSLNNLGELYSLQGRYKEAQTFLQEALAMYQALSQGDHPDTASSLNNLGELYASQGRYTQAEELFQESLAISENLYAEDHRAIAVSVNNLGELYASQGRYNDAAFQFQEALAMYRRLYQGDHRAIALTLNNLAELYQVQGRYTEAEALFKESLGIYQRLFAENHPELASSLNNLAEFYLVQGRDREAQPYLEKALAIWQGLYPGDHPAIAGSLNDLATFYTSQGRGKEAESFLKQALAMYQRLQGDDPNLARILHNLARLYYSQEEYREALKFLEQGTDLEETLLSRNLVSGSEQQKRAYLALFQNTTDDAISLHLQGLSEDEEAANLALTTILRRKGRVLDVLGNSLRQLQSNSDRETQTLFQELSQVQTQLSQLAYGSSEARNEEIAALEQEAKELEAALMKRSAEFRRQVEPVTIAPVQAEIPKDAVLLEFIQYRPINRNGEEYGNPRYAVYLLRSQGDPQWADLGDADAINQEIENLWEVLQSPPVPAMSPIRGVGSPAQTLYTQLLDPIRSAIADAEHLLIAPDSQLNLIPFAALVDADQRYLLERYRMTYLTSGRDLLRFQESKREAQTPLLLANPTYDRAVDSPTWGSNQRSGDLSNLQFAALPGTAEEGAAIAQLFPEFQLFTEAEATENRLKQATNPHFLHIATHGFFLPPQPQPLMENPLLRSGLALAGFNRRESGGEDGVVTALEVTGLNLRGTELVVLSACETGLGEVVQGEGVYGLRRAFTLAGAETQIMSLWQVADEQTKDLMVEYYQRLERGEGRGEALRQVQLEMLANPKTKSPFFWAAFIPVGNWEALPMIDN